MASQNKLIYLTTSRIYRRQGGLSVFTFLKIKTWLRTDDPARLSADAATLARLEGLEAHARAAERRLATSSSTAPGSRRD